MKKIRTIVILLGIFLVMGASLNGQTTICWDNSSSMENRDLEKDFSVLERIFEKDPNQELQLLLFNVAVTEKAYRIVEGDWQRLRNDLSSMVYDGGSVYANLVGKIKHEKVFVFTDGNGILKEDVLPLQPKSLIVNSSAERNIDFLNRTALLTKSRLMDFASMLPTNTAGTRPIHKNETIKGTVYLNNQPVQGVRVAVEDGEAFTMTDPNGSFTIDAQVGDSILVSSTANNTYKKLKITSKENTNIFLKSNVYKLDEVEVVEKQRIKKFVTTGLGIVDKDRLGYDVQSIGDEDITLINTTVSTAVQGKFAGVAYGQSDDLSQAVVRNGTSSLYTNNYALIVVDGIPLRQSNSAVEESQFSGGNNPNNTSISAADDLEITGTSYLNPDNIAEITLLKGLAATNRFGSLGANGVFLITTKGAVAGNNNAVNENYDTARLRNNIFDGKLNIKGKASIGYIEKLASAPNVADAYTTYLKQRYGYGKAPSYYLDVYEFFRPRNAKLAMRVASNIMEGNKITYGQLRSLFLKASKHRDYNLQRLVAKKLFEDFPEKTQTYYDMALAHINSGEHQLALDTFLSILDGSANEDLEFDGLQKRVSSELKDLIRKYEKDLDISKVPANYLNSAKLDARLVFDWNDEEAEFDIQFVNPQKRFFEWEHTNSGNSKRIEDELRNGYSSEQFILTGEGLEGKWIVNISYKGKRTNTENTLPTFIKCRVDYNFGSPNGYSEEYELRLTETSNRQFFFDFKINSVLAVR